MGVMYLPARVPNEGAHRLAWVVGRAPNPGEAIRQIEASIGVNTVDRLISGSLVPGERMGAALMLWSGGAIKVADFYRATALRWIDEPAARVGSSWRRPIPGRMIERGSALLARSPGPNNFPGAQPSGRTESAPIAARSVTQTGGAGGTVMPSPAAPVSVSPVLFFAGCPHA